MGSGPPLRCRGGDFDDAFACDAAADPVGEGEAGLGGGGSPGARFGGFEAEPHGHVLGHGATVAPRPRR